MDATLINLIVKAFDKSGTVNIRPFRDSFRESTETLKDRIFLWYYDDKGHVKCVSDLWRVSLVTGIQV